MVQPFWKAIWKFLTKLYILPPCDLTITFLGIYPNKLKTSARAKIYTQMFIATLLIIAKIQKQPRHPSIGEQINSSPSTQWNSIQPLATKPPHTHKKMSLIYIFLSQES